MTGPYHGALSLCPFPGWQWRVQSLYQRCKVLHDSSCSILSDRCTQNSSRLQTLGQLKARTIATRLGLPGTQSQAERTGARSTTDWITTSVFSRRKGQRVCGCCRGGRAPSHSPSLLTPVAARGAHRKLFSPPRVTRAWFASLQGRLQRRRAHRAREHLTAPARLHSSVADVPILIKELPKKRQFPNRS